MRLAMPVAAYHSGNPADYLAQSFERLGHKVDIINGSYELEASVRKHQHDFYMCVDSGGPIDLPVSVYNVDPSALRRLAFWFIDYRHNKHRPPTERNPNDEGNARLIDVGGGWVFQAQMPDMRDCWSAGIRRCSYLPLAADPGTWIDHSDHAGVYDVAFIGNVWDPVRAGVLQSMVNSGLKCSFNTTGHVWKKAAAEFTGYAKLGFNISSFFGEKFAYDVNMRVFETLCCGVPLVTNWVPDLDKFFLDAPFVITYRRDYEVLPTIQAALSNETFLNSRHAAREWVLNNATYDLRAGQIIQALQTAGIWPEETIAQEATDAHSDDLSQ